MADGETMVGGTAGDDHFGSDQYAAKREPIAVKTLSSTDEEALKSPVGHMPNPFSRQHSKIDLDDYFVRVSWFFRIWQSAPFKR